MDSATLHNPAEGFFPPIGPIEIGGRFYGVRASVVTALAASAIATGIVNFYTEDHTWTPEIQTGIAEDGSTVTTVQVSPEHPGLRNVTDPAPEQTLSKQNFLTDQLPYARNYDQDKVLEGYSPNAINGLKSAIADFKNEGWQNFKLVVQGEASAEDDMTRPDAGVTIPSTKNQALAEARATQFINEIKGDPDLGQLPIERQPGVEGQLTDDDLSMLDDMAAQYGYFTPANLIEAWNTGRQVPPAAEAFLQSKLGNQRQVVVTIMASKPGETAGQTHQEMVCVVPVKEITTTSEHWNTVNPPLPKFVLFPLPAVLPIVRRRKKLQSVTSPTPEAAGPPKRTPTATERNLAALSRLHRPKINIPKGPQIPNRSSEEILAGMEAFAKSKPDEAASEDDAAILNFHGHSEETAPVPAGEPLAPPVEAEAVDEPDEPFEEVSEQTEEAKPKEPKEPKHRKWPWIVAGGLVVAGAVLLSHCSGGSDNNNNGQPTATTQPPCPPDMKRVTEVVDREHDYQLTTTTTTTSGS